MEIETRICQNKVAQLKRSFMQWVVTNHRMGRVILIFYYIVNYFILYSKSMFTI